jgi:hypothetical protein
MTTFETIKFELQLDVDVDFSNEDLYGLLDGNFDNLFSDSEGSVTMYKYRLPERSKQHE